MINTFSDDKKSIILEYLLSTILKSILPLLLLIIISTVIIYNNCYCNKCYCIFFYWGVGGGPINTMSMLTNG